MIRSPDTLAQIVIVACAVLVNWVVLLQEESSTGQSGRVRAAFAVAVLLLPVWGTFVPIALLGYMNVPGDSKQFGGDWLFWLALVILGAGPIHSFERLGLRTSLHLASYYFLAGVLAAYYTDKFANELFSR